MLLDYAAHLGLFAIMHYLKKKKDLMQDIYIDCISKPRIPDRNRYFQNLKKLSYKWLNEIFT